MKPAYMQIVGMFGLTQSIRRTFIWGVRLMIGRIDRLSTPPASAVPMRSVGDATTAAPHAPVTVSISPRLRSRAGSRDHHTVSLPVAS